MLVEADEESCSTVFHLCGVDQITAFLKTGSVFPLTSLDPGIEKYPKSYPNAFSLLWFSACCCNFYAVVIHLRTVL